MPNTAFVALNSAAVDAVLHYSRRSSNAFLELARGAGLLNAALKLAHYCLSADVAMPLREHGAEQIEIAAEPNENAMLTLLG